MNKIKIEIDAKSGFCFGVVNAIKHAEKELKTSGNLYCLGDIVHNTQEVKRLSAKGMTTIDHTSFDKLEGERVLFRAHGEPPKVYEEAKKRGIKLIDATCPVVLGLQRKIKKCYEETRSENAQIIIYGKPGHAEVIGLVGQTEGNASVIQTIEDLEKIDFTRPIYLFSQTTMSLNGLAEIENEIKRRISPNCHFHSHDTICRQVANRIPHIAEFASKHDLIFFVAGGKSSNGKVLFNQCKTANPNSKFISSPDEINMEMFQQIPQSIGICGATSTPSWQMDQVQEFLKDLLKKNGFEIED